LFLTSYIVFGTILSLLEIIFYRGKAINHDWHPDLLFNPEEKNCEGRWEQIANGAEGKRYTANFWPTFKVRFRSGDKWTNERSTAWEGILRYTIHAVKIRLRSVKIINLKIVYFAYQMRKKNADDNCRRRRRRFDLKASKSRIQSEP